MLFAALNCVPVVGVAVENKVSGCLSDLFHRQPLAVVLEPGELETPDAGRSIVHLWSRRGTDSGLYARLLADYRARRQVNIDAIGRAVWGRVRP